MGIAIILLGFPLSILAWVLIARKLKQKSYSGLSRHLAGFAGSFVVWWLCAIVGTLASPELMEATNAKAEQDKKAQALQSQTASTIVSSEPVTKPEPVTEANTTDTPKAKQDQNITAFFERTGGYRVENGEMSDGYFVIDDASKNKYTIKPVIFSSSNGDSIQNDVNRAMWEGVFRVFAHLPIDSLDVTIAPQIAKNATTISDDMKRLKDFNIHIKTTRAEALAALQKHAGVQSFDELVDFTGELGEKGTLQSKTFLTLRKDPVKSYLIYKDIAAK
ncbi:hypothetical protein LVJ82_04635 [Vitreoscilla massiliensis]|uniref:DUF4190 domain-containing protein n=1 Tax=Vitreoscilla massiliensis TaxID=1689272 RepID=A0ABY4E3E8_9NEIS|nr:hypothetical protein [Vitreoscilla massiliensis]UOO90278.1 hypothetical protein LVJ82_04635 [Vitreoscilla massiliensis]